MDPNHLESLVHAFAPYGPVLVAAMNPMPSAGNKGPMPYGCLVQWHARTNLCYSTTTGTIDGFTPWAPKNLNLHTPVMTHIWPAPVPGGPRALDRSDPDGGGGHRPNTTGWHQPPERSQPRPGRGLPSGSSRGRAVRQCRSGAIRKNHR